MVRLDSELKPHTKTRDILNTKTALFLQVNDITFKKKKKKKKEKKTIKKKIKKISQK